MAEAGPSTAPPAAGEPPAETPAEAIQRRQAELHETIEARRLRAAQEAAALEGLQHQLRLAAGPRKETVEELRAALEASSGDVEAARLDFVAARDEVADAKKRVEVLTETKEALSERLMSILAANEAAKLTKLDELRDRLDVAPPAGVATPPAAAPAEEGFEGFDEVDVATQSSGHLELELAAELDAELAKAER